MDLEKVKQYHEQLQTLWNERKKADDRVTDLLRDIRDYNNENHLNMSLLENGRIDLNFAFNRQEQQNRVSTFLTVLDNAIKNGE